MKTYQILKQIDAFERELTKAQIEFKKLLVDIRKLIKEIPQQ